MCENLNISGLSGISFAQPNQTKVNENMLSGPRIVPDNSMEARQKVTWDCIWFGSYPQAEVVPANEEYTALPESFLQTDDLIKNDRLYQILKSAISWDKQGDIVIDGEKYCRIKKEDATYTSAYSGYYK